jgi:Reverse transcriptase (RNA-dependent DNA polymerase)
MLVQFPQGAVISVTLFLIAINPITKLESNKAKMIGYADDWVVYSASDSPHTANENVQTVIHRIDEWTSKNGFNISTNKTKSLMISRRAKDTNEPEIQIQGQKVANVLQHKILGLNFDFRLNWKAHLKAAKLRAENKISIIKCLASTKMSS